MKREEKFRKKPVIVEAFQFTDESKDAAYRWASSHQMNIQPSFDDYKAPILLIPTLEGEMICRIGDWIIRGVNGEFYPCKPDIFEKTYEPATPLPPAEGAEAILHRHIDKQSMDELSVNVWPDILEAMTEFAAQQPTAEGAEEINKMIGQTKDSISKRYNKNYWEILVDYYSNGRLTTNDFIDELLNEFAALHAQKIADKMVGERLRKELIKFDAWGYGSFTENQAIINDVDEYLKAEKDESINRQNY